MDFNSEFLVSNRSNDNIDNVYNFNEKEIYQTKYEKNINKNDCYNKSDNKDRDEHQITRDTLDNINTTVGTIYSNKNQTISNDSYTKDRSDRKINNQFNQK